MISQLSGKFGGHRHYVSGDTLLVVYEQDLTFSINSAITIFLLKHIVCHVHTYKISLQQ